MARKRKPKPRRSSSAGPSARGGGNEIRARQVAGGNAWELVHPRCARDRADDLDEAAKMIEHGETEIARDELLWLLSGCTDCLLGHKMLGELALAEGDVRLARGHFGYAFELGAKALDRAGVKGNLAYRTPANQAFFEAGKGLAFCLRELGKLELAADVVARLLACDPSDPLGVRNLLAAAAGGSTPGETAPTEP